MPVLTCDTDVRTQASQWRPYVSSPLLTLQPHRAPFTADGGETCAGRGSDFRPRRSCGVKPMPRGSGQRPGTRGREGWAGGQGRRVSCRPWAPGYTPGPHRSSLSSHQGRLKPEAPPPSTAGSRGLPCALGLHLESARPQPHQDFSDKRLRGHQVARSQSTTQRNPQEPLQVPVPVGCQPENPSPLPAWSPSELTLAFAVTCTNSSASGPGLFASRGWTQTTSSRRWGLWPSEASSLPGTRGLAARGARG